VGSALLVVDVQNDVVASIPGVAQVVATIAGLVDRARATGSPVVWVQHQDEDLEHGSPGWRIVPELVPARDEVIVEKCHRSAFADTDLAYRLRERGVTEIVLTGTQSAFCVDMAGKHALAEGFDVTLVSDGHANGDLDTADGIVPDRTVRALINRTWRTLGHPGREVMVTPAAGVRLGG
jgi:nicotinamidase-related amidase